MFRRKTDHNNKLILLVISILQLNIYYAICHGNTFHQLLGKNKLWGLRSDGSNAKNIIDTTATTTNKIVRFARGGDDYNDDSSSIDNTDSIVVDKIKEDEEEEDDDNTDNNDVEFHEKVQKALAKLGLSSTQEESAIEEQEESCCANGVCSMPNEEGEDSSSSGNGSIAMDTVTTNEEEEELNEEEIIIICKTLSEELSIPINMCQAVVYSIPNTNSKLQEKAREILLYEKRYSIKYK